MVWLGKFKQKYALHESFSKRPKEQHRSSYRGEIIDIGKSKSTETIGKFMGNNLALVNIFLGMIEAGKRHTLTSREENLCFIADKKPIVKKNKYAIQTWNGKSAIWRSGN